MSWIVCKIIRSKFDLDAMNGEDLQYVWLLSFPQDRFCLCFIFIRYFPRFICIMLLKSQLREKKKKAKHFFAIHL